MITLTSALHIFATLCVVSTVSYGKIASKMNAAKEASIPRKHLVSTTEYETKLFSGLQDEIDSGDGDSVDVESDRKRMEFL